LRRSQEQVRSALEDVMETIERGAATLGEAAEKAGEEARTELAVLPEQLADARRAVVALWNRTAPQSGIGAMCSLGFSR
jgi:hypothetical protein